MNAASELDALPRYFFDGIITYYTTEVYLTGGLNDSLDVPPEFLVHEGGVVFTFGKKLVNGFLQEVDRVEEFLGDISDIAALLDQVLCEFRVEEDVLDQLRVDWEFSRLVPLLHLWPMVAEFQDGGAV